MVISSPKHKIPTRVYSPFTFVFSENVFCQDMVVLWNPVCVLLSGMPHVYKSDVSVAVFETWWPPEHWLRSTENRRIVWTCIFEAAGSKAEGSISYSYRFHIGTRFAVRSLKPGPPRQWKPIRWRNWNNRFQHFQFQPIKYPVQNNEISTCFFWCLRDYGVT